MKQRARFSSPALQGAAAWLAAAMLLVSAPAAVAEEMKAAADWAGTWRGTYVCLQGVTGLTLTIHATSEKTVTAIFSFHAVPTNPAVPSGSFRMKGELVSDPSHLRLNAGAWRKRPPGYVTVDLDGDYNPRAGEYVGRVDFDGCSDFVLRRDLTS